MKDTAVKNQVAESDYSTAKILGIDYAMQGMAVFSEKIETEEAGFLQKNEKRLAREQRKLSRCVRGSHNYELQKRKLPDVMKRYEIREEIICTNLVERLQIIMMQLQWKISI